MYICLCHAITEKDIQEASMDKGPAQEVLGRLGVGKDCGACLSQAIKTYLKQKGPLLQKGHARVFPAKQR
ncbi:MAG: (2Fe-2S)-binding protein [Bacteriovoracales bacterium]|nr:(2Fe-2S)-binding protein [Bacteriovoracales bacterium]